MDPATKPGADFFLHANGGWYAKADIPADRPATGIWLTLTQEIEKRTTQLLDDAVHASAPAGSSQAEDRRLLRGLHGRSRRSRSAGSRRSSPSSPASRASPTRKSLAAYLGSELRADVDALNSGHVHTDASSASRSTAT